MNKTYPVPLSLYFFVYIFQFIRVETPHIHRRCQRVGAKRLTYTVVNRTREIRHILTAYLGMSINLRYLQQTL